VEFFERNLRCILKGRGRKGAQGRGRKEPRKLNKESSAYFYYVMVGNDTLSSLLVLLAFLPLLCFFIPITRE